MNKTEWQPIDTAPKDGTHILIRVKFPEDLCMGPATIPTYWRDLQARGGHGNSYRGWSGELSSSNVTLWEIEGCGGTPTHWMPLPWLMHAEPMGHA
jgi:hypothetical protein